MRIRPFFGRSRHPAQELVIAFILVGLEVEIAGTLLTRSSPSLFTCVRMNRS